jgi:hypothetical protein
MLFHFFAPPIDSLSHNKLTIKAVATPAQRQFQADEGD